MYKFKKRSASSELEFLLYVVGITAIVVCVVLLAWGMPKYRIYKQDLAGQANLRQQEWEKQILVEEAEAELEVAKLKAASEIERAYGIAEANSIIGESLKNNNEYLKYLMIDQMSDMETQLIYIPTEAGLPILEAGK